MEFDLNSSINLSNTPKIPRSKSSAPKSQEDLLKLEKKLDRTQQSKIYINTQSKINQESKIQVHIRTRPLIDIEIAKSAKKIIKTISDSRLNLSDEREFDFDYVYSDSISNAEVFEKSVKNNISKALEGYNFSILAYGQTGSGKTYTVGTNQNKTNDKDNQKDKGIIQNSIEYIFKSIKNKIIQSPIRTQKFNLDDIHLNNSSNFAESTKNISNSDNSFSNDNESSKFEYIIKASFIEIYNEEIIDLLNIKTPSKHILIRNINNLTTLSGVSQINVNEPDDCFQLLNTGINNRKTSSTNMNEKSSRSHAVFTLYFEKICSFHNLNESGQGLNANNIPINFKINFIDLAGSERLKKTGATGDRFKESVSINSGLLALSKVIMALSENNSKIHIPYRDSKLTLLLKDSLNGSSITLIFACVSPSDTNYEETLNTLNYASFAKSINVNPLINFNVGNLGGAANNTKKYEEIINKLKNENIQLSKQIEEMRLSENKELEIIRLKNVVKTLKKKILIKNVSANFKEDSSKLTKNLNESNSDEDIKSCDFDKNSFLNFSEYMNEDEDIVDEIRNKTNDEQDMKIINSNKNDYEYISRIKENNMLKRENEDLKNQIENLLKDNKELKKKKYIDSSSLLNFENVDQEINPKYEDLNNLVEFNNICKEGLSTQLRKSKAGNMDTELSIKDLQGLEIDQKKLEEESNFLLNYDNDLMIAQLSESLANKKEIAKIESNYNVDYFNGLNLNKNSKSENNYNKLIGPIFNDNILNFDNDQLLIETCLDINKSIEFKKIEDRDANTNEDLTNTSQDLKTIISKVNNDDAKNSKDLNKSNIDKKGIPKYQYNFTSRKNSYKYDKKQIINSISNKISKNKFVNVNLSNIDNRSLDSSINSNNSMNKKQSKLNYRTIKKSENSKLQYSSCGYGSSNNCSKEKVPNRNSNRYFSKTNNSLNLKNIKGDNSYVSPHRNAKNPSPNNYQGNLDNTNPLNQSHVTEMQRIRLQHNISLINKKISQLREYQRSLREKIMEGEIQKNKILKNKNEEISYMKKNANDKQRILKNLEQINEKNKKIIEKSENTIKSLNIELRNKSMEIRNLHTNSNNSSLTYQSNFNINNEIAGNENNTRISNIFSSLSKFIKNNNNSCCNRETNKTVSFSLQQKGSCLNLSNKRKNRNDNLRNEKNLNIKDNEYNQNYSSINKLSSNNILPLNQKNRKISQTKLIYPDVSKENIFKTTNLFKNDLKKANESSTSKYNLKSLSNYNNNLSTLNNYDSKISKVENKNLVEDKIIMNTLKVALGELEKLFIEKNKCQKRMNNLQIDKKEIIQLKKQNLERYNLRLKALKTAKLRIENTLKQEEPQSMFVLNTLGNCNPSSIVNQKNIAINNDYSPLNTIGNINVNKSNNNYYNSLILNNDIPVTSSFEKKNDSNNYRSSENTNINNNNINYINTSPNVNVSQKSFKINGIFVNNKDINNSTSISTSKEKNITANSNNYNQKVQKLTAIIYKITAVNERIDRINNLQESTLSEIILSEDILFKQMKNIEASINNIKMQLSNSSYNPKKEKGNYDSIEALRKELEDNLINNINVISKNESTITVENTEFNEILTTKNFISNLDNNLNKQLSNYEKNFTDNNKSKLDKLFEKIYEMKMQLEEKDSRLKKIENDNLNKEKLIKNMQKKLDLNLNRNNYNRFNVDESNGSYDKSRNETNNDSVKIKNEDYFCNIGYDKNLSFENSKNIDKRNEYKDQKKDKSNNNLVSITNNNIYNISLTPKRINIKNDSNEKKMKNQQKNNLPPPYKKK